MESRLLKFIEWFFRIPTDFYWRMTVLERFVSWLFSLVHDSYYYDINIKFKHNKTVF